MIWKILWIVLVFNLIINSLQQTPQDDEVFVMDLKEYNHRYYSGYLNISTDSAIHYMFFQSQKNAAQDPLILYLVGGPGCSSLLGMLQENGPFIYKPENKTLDLNPNAWNKRANLLYLQVPAGVGFSETKSLDKDLTDQTTAFEALSALQIFYTRFTSLRANPIYFSGHAYAAVYLAYLSKMVIQLNQDPFLFDAKINFKGLLLGNPCTLSNQCYATGSQKFPFYHYQYLYKRGYFLKYTIDQFLGACTMGYDTSYQCYEIRKTMDAFFNKTKTSRFNIYARCHNDSNITVDVQCQDQSAVIQFLNMNSTKQNWHITPETVWQTCNSQIFRRYYGLNGSYWLYPYLLKKNLRIWIYSGDLDSSVSIIGTKTWISRLKEQLDIPIKKVWRQWWVPGLHKGEDQVGGFIWELEGLNLVTIKGAGLRSAMDQPVAMQQVLNNFLDGKTLPYKDE